MHTSLTQSAGALLSLALLSGCATIASGTRQPIKFTSEPSGADIRVDNIVQGTTPAELELSTRKRHTVRIELAGYQPYQVELERKLNGWIFGNLFFGGLIGVIVDVGTGAVYGLTPNEVHAHLRSGGAGKGRRLTSAGTPESVLIATTLQPDPHWKKIGQLARN